MEEQVLRKESSAPAIIDARVDQYGYLIGSPPIREFVEFVQNRSVKGIDGEQDRLISGWRGAANHLRDLETTEGGFADNAEVMPLPEGMAILAEQHLQDPRVRRSLAHHPHRWAIVDLDQVISHQRCLNRSSVRHLAARFPARPTDEELFRLASGQLMPPPEILVTRVSENVFAFTSPSPDLRPLELTVLEPSAVAEYHVPGQLGRIVAVAVGYSINCAAVFRMQGRLILHNGTHRASMAYERGIRKFPCLVRELSNEDDLDWIRGSDIKQSLHLYLRSRRPPRLGDFFNPRLHTVIPVAATCRVVHVQLNTQVSRVPVL